MERLKNKIAIITGAASGIGKATAKAFGNEGASLILADKNKLELLSTVNHLRNSGIPVNSTEIDVSEEAEVKELIENTVLEYGRVDILCNNAGISAKVKSLEDQDKEEWQRIFNINVMGCFYGIKYVSKHMKDRHYGSIVNTASIAGIRSGAGPNSYSASKAAIINLTQTAACDLGGFNVRVNAVCPGLIETGMTKKVFDMAKRKQKQHKLGYRCELRRYGKPEEVANLILFLAGDESSYITGQSIPVDGGNSASFNLPGMKY